MLLFKTFDAMKKIFSLVIVLAAVAMVSCGGNANKKAAAEAAATEAAATEASVCTEECDSTAACEQADTTACEAAAETVEAAK